MIKEKGEIKMKNNKALLGVLAFSIVLLLGVSMVSAMSHGQGKQMMKQGNGNFGGDHEAIQTAIENNDFASWKSLMEARITEDNFNEMVKRHSEMISERASMQEEMQEFHQAMADGDYDKAKELKEELMPEEDRENSKKGKKNFFKGFFNRF